MPRPCASSSRSSVSTIAARCTMPSASGGDRPAHGFEEIEPEHRPERGCLWAPLQTRRADSVDRRCCHSSSEGVPSTQSDCSTSCGSENAAGGLRRRARGPDPSPRHNGLETEASISSDGRSAFHRRKRKPGRPQSCDAFARRRCSATNKRIRPRARRGRDRPSNRPAHPIVAANRGRHWVAQFYARNKPGHSDSQSSTGPH